MYIIQLFKFIQNIIDKIFNDKDDKTPVVSWDENKIICCFPDQTMQMKWENLRAVVVETTDEGPWMEDVYFVLFTDEIKDSFQVPQCARGSQALLEKLTSLPRFDDRAVIKAMGCTSNKSFLCWEELDWPGKNWPRIKAARNY